jgi:hypothetical protein
MQSALFEKLGPFWSFGDHFEQGVNEMWEFLLAQKVCKLGSERINAACFEEDAHVPEDNVPRQETCGGNTCWPIE